MLDEKNAAVAASDHHNRAEPAIEERQPAGIDIEKLSIVRQDHHTEENVVGYDNVGDRMKIWGRAGAFVGRSPGMAVGSSHVEIPRGEAEWRESLEGARGIDVARVREGEAALRATLDPNAGVSWGWGLTIAALTLLSAKPRREERPSSPRWAKARE